MANDFGLTRAREGTPVADFRKLLPQLIRAQFGSRYKFCIATGVDQGHLSRVIAGKQKGFSVEALARVFGVLGYDVILVPKNMVKAKS